MSWSVCRVSRGQCIVSWPVCSVLLWSMCDQLVVTLWSVCHVLMCRVSRGQCIVSWPVRSVMSWSVCYVIVSVSCVA